MAKLRRFIFTILLLLITINVFASNLQKTYTVKDEIYKRVDRLTREAGVIGPSSFSPVTGRVLEIALNRIDTSKLNPMQLNEYNELYDEITNSVKHNSILYDDDFGLDLGLNVALTLNVEDYDKFDYMTQKVDHRNDALIPYRDQDAFGTIYPKIYIGDNVFLEGKFELRNNNRRTYESSLGWLITKANGQMGIFGHGYFNGIAAQPPYKAGLSIGNDYISFILGRYPHSIGSGITGNLMVGDNFIYQEMANLSFISNYFSYNMSVTRFDQMKNLKKDGLEGYGLFSREEFSGSQQFRIVHHFDINFFSKVRLALDFSTIYNSSNGLDLRFFYPFVIAHNYYNYTNDLEKTYFDEANNLLVAYLEVAPIKGLSIGAQFALDQFQVFFEDQTSVPSAWGALANIKYTAPINNRGHLDTWFEFAYTNPYLYLNGKYDEGGGIDYNLDYIVGYHANHVPDYGYSGYQYGPDTIMFALGGEYIENNWESGLKIIYRVSGSNRLGNLFYHNAEKNEDSYIIDMSNSIISTDYQNISSPSCGWANAEHLFQPVIHGKYVFDYYNLEISGAVAFSTYFNYEFEKGKTMFLPQATISVKWTGINNEWFK